MPQRQPRLPLRSLIEWPRFMKRLLSRDDTPLPAPPYTMLAQIYDQIMLHVNYPRWARYIHALLKAERCRPEMPLLDIGCGTGRFLEEMQRFGYYGDGCDPSGEMLEVARKRLPERSFFRDALPAVEQVAPDHYPIITCLYDTMNYVLERSNFEQALAAVFHKLTSPGLFIFDVVSEAHCKHYFQHYSDSEVLSKDIAYTRESFYEASTQSQYNWIRIYTPEGIFEEVHHQRVYHYRDILEMIRQHSGFAVKAYEEFTLSRANEGSGRVHFVLLKS